MRRPGQVLAVCLVLLLAGCGGQSGQGTGTSVAKAAKPIVGVVLPDKTTSARWEEQDRPLLSSALNYADIEPLIMNAEGDETKFASIVDEMVKRQVKVLMITPLSQQGGQSAQRKAKDAGIPVIDYDRVTLGGQAEYHVGFDSVNVGQLQADGLLQCLGNKPGAQIIEIEGAPSDHNATLFSQGQRQRLGQKYDSGALKLVKSQPVEDWDNVLGGQLFAQILDGNGGKVDGVVAANDGLAGAVIEVLKSKGLAGKVPVTGQDATMDGLRAVLRGEQCMTVDKPVRDEAEAAARLAIAIARGDNNGADDLATGNMRDPIGKRDIKAVLLGANLITKNTVRTLVTSGVVKPAVLCAGDIAPICAEQNILAG
jgi:D-xylose transport system substrate-binding protein